jgi:competence protein ComEA
MVFHGGISLKRTLSLKKKKQIAAALAAAVFVCGGCTGNLKEEQDEILLETVAESSENLEHADDAEQSEAGETLPETAETRLGSTIYVHVCGHVKYPGVYQMQEGSRVYEAIDKAGGMLEEGAGDAMNMAAVLEDGMRIMVPDLAQAAQMIEQGAVFDPGSSASVSDRKSSGKVNLNRADVKELMTLTGIGQSRAEAIIRYREEIGSFERIEDVMKVSGIKESAFNKIKDDITV